MTNTTHHVHAKPINARRPFLGVDALHKRLPKVAQKLSLATSVGTITAQSLAWGMPLFGLGATKLAGQRLPFLQASGKTADKTIVQIADRWIRVNNFLIDKVLPSRDWRICLPDDLDMTKKYLLVCNHQSWVDTSIIQYISQDRLPLTRFFIKHELIYIPVVGQTFYLLDFPMMKRHSKDKIAKNPALARQDLMEARRACGLLADKSFVLLNYLEGTRFTRQKHAEQASPYRHLLKPKAGGFATALSSLGDKIDGILDMTIVYPDGVPAYEDLWAGKLTRLGVDIRPVAMDEKLFEALSCGRYGDDGDTKAQLHAWLDELWRAKDERIDEMLAQFC